MKVSQERNEEYHLILIRFALERFLFRLQNSRYARKFVLKGAFLLILWTRQYLRSTKDLDLLSRIPDLTENISQVFKEVCEIDVEPDGVVYDSDNMSVEQIIEGAVYHGLRVKLTAYLGKIRIPLQFDIGFGDPVYPSAKVIEYPSLLDFPNPKVLAYPVESLISEKVHSIVNHGMQNSRMKDFYDVYSLIKTINIDKPSLKCAIQSTFEHRGTEIPGGVPIALTDEFAYDKDKKTQWRQFIRKNDISNAPEELPVAINVIREFLQPIFESCNNEKA